MPGHYRRAGLRLVQKIIDLGMQAMEEAWAVVTPSKFAMEDTESNPQLVQIVPPNEVVVVVKFELKMGNCAGTIGLCIPYKVIEPVIEKLSNKSWASHKLNQRDEELRRHVAMRLNTAKLHRDNRAGGYLDQAQRADKPM